MFKVNIYIETSIHGPSKRDGACMYLIEYLKQDGTPVTRVGKSSIESTTELELALTAMIAAVGKLTKPCEVQLYTTCNNILNAVRGAWHIQWQKNDWKNAKGNPVKCADLWQQYIEKAGPHTILILNEKHSYKNWMQNELQTE